MSNDEDDFQYYGTLLEPYEEDEVPKKKAFSIEDQVATDEQGRRRFHGAFTGGFSAGFFNTVGSLEGWKPSEFKSSRSEKAKQKYQKPQDFMDDEDVGQFGIAPSVVRATSDFSNTETRKRTLKSDGSIPGVPVLHSILQPSRETVGIRLLKKMGWKPGQGVGPRISKTEKRRQNRENKSNSGKVYGCEIPEEFRKPQIENESSSEDDVDITYAPDDYDSFLYKAKDNTFGMGYSGLDKRPVLSSHINLFGPSEFTMQDHKSNKISISGQAFGVGAFENEDDDIYAGEDMTKYDFELDSSLKKNKKKPKKQEKTKENIVDGFVLAQSPVIVKKSFPVPVLPKNFIPKHGARISRFEPLPETHKMFNFDRTKTMGRHDLSAEQRSKILNSFSEIITPQRPATKEILLSKILDTPLEKEKKIIKVQAAKITNTLPNTQLGPFKPFLTNPEKQKRYEEYLSLRRLNQEEKLADFQSVMSEAERDRERYEFAQAARMFKPVAGLVFDKFVAASSQDESLDPLKPVGRSVFEHGTQDMRDAAKKKMFGTLTRIIEAWRPHKLLCKRFNVPDPDISEVEKTLSRKKRNKYSVFDYYEAYKQNKTIKVGPEPKQIETENKVEEVQSSPPKEIKEVNPTLAKYISSDIPEEIAPSNLNNDCKINKVLITPSTSSSIPIIDSNESNIIPNSNSNKFESKTQLPTDPKEKLDLFKAIFLSSSDESENEKDEPQKKPEEKITEMKKILLEEEPKESVVVKPNKGIFADLDWSKINRNIPEQKKVDKIVKEKETENLFGPELPAQISKQTTNTSPWKPVFTKQSVEDSGSSEDEWTEVDSSVEKSTKNYVKKHKKHKSKHKKHKSKHKKKKHSGRIK